VEHELLGGVLVFASDTPWRERVNTMKKNPKRTTAALRQPQGSF
jgi:hypothetical protein